MHSSDHGCRHPSKETLLWFTVAYWRPHWELVLLSMTAMLSATVLSLTIPLSAKEVATYGGVSTKSAPTPSSDGFDMNFISSALGRLSEALFLRVAVLFSDESVYLQGLLCRCILMAAVVALYHVVSLVAHLVAYRAGMATQAGMIEDGLARILNTRHPERIAVVSAIKLTHIITSSAKTSGDMLATVLTDVLSSVLSATGLLVALLLISAKLTLLIGVMVSGVQYVYLVAGKNQGQRATKLAVEESAMQAGLSNAIQRSETIFIFDCRPFILRRLRSSLSSVQHLANGFNQSIHGYAAISSGSTTMIFVVVLGVCSYHHKRGTFALTDVALFFMFLQQFVQRLLQLSKDWSTARATLGRLKTLKSMLEWYDEPLRSADEDENIVELQVGERGDLAPHPSAKIIVADDGDSALELKSVVFTYPAAPSFFSNPDEESGPASLDDSVASPVPASPRSNGIQFVSLRAAPGVITALYGPSGSGKSTCLRLLGGLLRPHAGVVRTQRRVLLLEQQHAIFLGTVAENILLQDLHMILPPQAQQTSPSSPSRSHDGGAMLCFDGSDNALWASKYGVAFNLTKEKVQRASAMSGCSGFLGDPFSEVIQSVEHPQFSGGQLQRICLARVFARNEDCTLILLDEPTTGLDSASVDQLLVMIKQLRDVYHKTVLISTHDHRVADVADKVIDLSH